MPRLTDLPAEILHHILGYVDPEDLAWIPRINKHLYHAVTDNTVVFKQAYLHFLDAPPQGRIDWERSLKDVVRLKTICGRVNVDDKKHELDFVHRVVIELLKNAATDGGARPNLTAKFPESRNADFLCGLFSVESNRMAFLCQSFIFERVRAITLMQPITYWDGPPKPEHQKSAQLHCLFGVPQLFADPSPIGRQFNRMCPMACSRVYDLRQYSEKNQWGPFMNDGSMRVDWEKVEAVMLVLGSNMTQLGLSRMRMCETFCSTPFAGTWPNSWKPQQPLTLPREPDPLEYLDPYGVTGVWLRVVCFLDYSDFFAYNFESHTDIEPHVPLPPLFDGEALRLILMRIFVTRIEKPSPEDGQDLPVVHFKGVARSLDQNFDENADSDIKGTVRLTPDGDVRWTTYSIFGGVERWRSESVQIGGVKSAKGVVGHWFDKDFDPHGPAGPSAFWKVLDKSRPSNGAHIEEVVDQFMDELGSDEHFEGLDSEEEFAEDFESEDSGEDMDLGEDVEQVEHMDVMEQPENADLEYPPYPQAVDFRPTSELNVLFTELLGPPPMPGS
ncbi:hypothetical protein GGS21DRAFT_515634 [Xylaria nigripes]|nr:hypothetical protein GGS21DRAFT_515634 [Xylaria nigripes]